LFYSARADRMIPSHRPVVQARHMHIRFDGQVAAISGAGHGFGLAIAQSLAALGARVYGTVMPGQAAPAGADGITFRETDLTDRAAAAAWISSVEAASGHAVDILINNAGGVMGQVMQPLEGVSDAAWDAVFAINIHATFALCRAVAPGMRRQKHGRIINIGSNAGLRPSLTGIQAYTSAKHAVSGLTKQLALELGPDGITVNCIAPGFFRTNAASEKQWDSYGENGQDALLGRIALRRLGTAEDIASACIFFASPLAPYVTGQILSVDGGR
jgi:3-oxoacyl-[acyl-carrier protein] reductase